VDRHTDHDEEIAQVRELIRRSRALLKVTKKLIATSMDQLTESRERIRAAGGATKTFPANPV
jgi:hypothetical protein